MQRVRLTLLLAFPFSASVQAQVDVYHGPSANIAGPAIDFDNPPVPGGPLQPGVFAGTGIRNVTRVGGGWPFNGYFTGPGYADRMLVSQNGVLSVWLPGQAAEWPAVGDGWEIELDVPVDEFQLTFTVSTPQRLRAELFLGPTSLGASELWVPSDPTPFFLRSPLGPFDRLRLEATTVLGPRGIDDLAFGFGPAPARPSNDECVTALPVTQGATMYSTAHATPSPEPVVAIQEPFGDIWFEYTTVSTGNELRFDLCGSSFTAALELYLGPCGALGTPGEFGLSWGCPNTQSFVRNNTVAGDRYLLRIGSGSHHQPHGTGLLSISEGPAPPVPQTCLETLFVGDRVTALGGAVYFDVDAGDELEIIAIELNTPQVGNFQLDFGVYTIPGTWIGNAGNPGGAGWTHVGTAHVFATGWNQRTVAHLAQTWVLPEGPHGVALVAGPNLQIAYSSPTPTNQQATSGDGYLTLTAGGADDVPWSGALQGAQVWNGRLCLRRVNVGTSYCNSTVNSTGVMALLIASGSDVVLDNDLRLELRELPPNAFLFFITSTTPGFFPHAGNSDGNLCLGGAIGRYVGSGQIQNSGSMQTASLALDLTQHPTPTGFVSVQPGETWRFQAWYRDSGGGVAHQNFSDAIAVTFR